MKNKNKVINISPSLRRGIDIFNVFTKDVYLMEKFDKLGIFLKNNLRINIKVDAIINLIDYLILIIVIFSIVGDLIYLVSSLINHLIELYNINGCDFISYMSEPLGGNTSSSAGGSNVQASSSTTTTIIHDDGSWSNAVRSIFIYGAGGLRLSQLKNGGTPGSRVFVMVGTIAGDSISRIINNTINDPSYVRNHYQSWRTMWLESGEGSVKVTLDSETGSKISEILTKKFISDGGSLGDLIQVYLTGIFESFKYILKPVQVTYSNEVLTTQIYDLSILLFILSVIIVGLIIVLLINMFLYIYMDKIINFFNSKFIKWYLVINKKLITIEILILGVTIIYFMYTLTTGIHFIATHPIIIN